MTISQTDIKQLWGRSASTCNICRCELGGATAEGKVSIVGEMAHIVAEKEGGPRGRSILTSEERNSYFNLILLCSNCHTRIDRDPTNYPVEKLHMLKAQHELRVRGEMVYPLQVISTSELNENVSTITEFTRIWLKFIRLHVELYNVTQLIEHRDMVEGWDQARRQVKEALYKAGEKNLEVQKIRDWERLKRSNSYISEEEHLTPFSYITNFQNPISMVAIEGNEARLAGLISYEFIDYLSYRYPEVKEVLEENA